MRKRKEEVVVKPELATCSNCDQDIVYHPSLKTWFHINMTDDEYAAFRERCPGRKATPS